MAAGFKQNHRTGHVRHPTPEARSSAALHGGRGSALFSPGGASGGEDTDNLEKKENALDSQENELRRLSSGLHIGQPPR